MPTATVLIPTHNHVEPLREAIASVQAQTLKDFELFIVGDGVGDATRKQVAELAATDSRIRFFDLPKGPRKGEVHRHEALQQASGRFVAYLGDDDVWMPMHLSTLDALLQRVDFGHTMHIGAGGAGKFQFLCADLENPLFRRLMLERQVNRFDFTFTGHTLEAYRRLPHGWRTTPPEFPWTDLYMWRQFLAEPWCRAASAMVPTAICTATHLRPDLSDRERAEELVQLRRMFGKAGFREAMWRRAARQFARETVGYALTAMRRAERSKRQKT
jgi:glycosyltransferase involved in cell wall biosynthesis